MCILYLIAWGTKEIFVGQGLEVKVDDLML